MLLVSSCAAQIDHPINAQLAQELAERSKSGLALARFSEADNTLEVRFFDGDVEKVPLEINGELKVGTQGKIAVREVNGR